MMTRCATAAPQMVRRMHRLWLSPNWKPRALCRTARASASKATRAIARDSKGRIYKEAGRLEPATESATPPIIMIDLYEPPTKTYTFIYPQCRTFWKGTLQRPPSALAREYFYGWPTRNGLPVNRFVKKEDLGSQTIDGMPVHGAPGDAKSC